MSKALRWRCAWGCRPPPWPGASCTEFFTGEYATKPAATCQISLTACSHPTYWLPQEKRKAPLCQAPVARCKNGDCADTLWVTDTCSRDHLNNRIARTAVKQANQGEQCLATPAGGRRSTGGCCLTLSRWTPVSLCWVGAVPVTGVLLDAPRGGGEPTRVPLEALGVQSCIILKARRLF
jgi:hypothetical protein